MNSPFTVLIVDDEKHNRNLLTELLKDDYELIVAKNGRQALLRAHEHQPDLILLDVLMPDMDGYAVIRALKHDDGTRDIPVIFVTALDSVGDEEKGLDLGAVDYISKPFHPPIVRVRVRNHLQSVQQRRLLEQLALLDSLTGIPNRRRFNQVFEQEWRRCLRTGAAMSLIVVDVDNFKAFNDSFGHAAGDEVLRRIASSLQKSLRRPADLVCRYGGEEFVILLPGIDKEGAQALAEAARFEIEAQHVDSETSGAPTAVTVSMGGVTRVPHQTTPDLTLFSDADASLYRAKHLGRNRVVWDSAAPGASPFPRQVAS
nr:diguanylate cyclase [Zoogloeaceae bacterium]